MKSSSFAREQRTRWALRAMAGLLVLLAGCGGGGGGGGEAPASTPATPVGLQALELSATNMVDAATYATGSGEWMLQVGQFAVDVANRTLARSGPPTVQTCPNGGQMATSLQDRDGNARLSSGDRLTVEMQDCGVAMMGAVLAGTVVIELAVVGAAPAEALLGQIDFGAAGVVLSNPAGQTSGVTVRMHGGLGFEWSRSNFASTLRVRSTAVDDLSMTGVGGGRTVTEAFRAIDVSKALRLDEARSQVSMALLLDSEILGGRLSVTTPQPVRAYLNTYPETGRIEVRGAASGVVRIKSRFVVASDQFDVELDSNGDGPPEQTTSYRWADAVDGYLWWDGQSALSWSAGTPYSARPFLATDFSYSVGNLNSPSVQEVFRLQFSRPPASGDALHFRFRDDGTTLNVFDGQQQHVAATVERQGALTLIRPSSALRHARRYTLEVSADGVNWFGNTVQVRDSLGNSVTIFGTLGSFATGDTLRAVITSTGQLLSSAADTVQLSASSSFSTLRPIASYRWRQIGGTPLEIGAPQAAVTSLRWGAVAPMGQEKIIIELQVTDTAGETETAQVAISSLNLQQTSGRVLYFRGTAGDYISAGQTVLATDSTGSWAANPNNSGYVTFSYNEANFGTWWTLNLASADGSPLRVGAYDNAVRAPFRGNMNGLELSGSGRGCNQIIGRFDVLEISIDTEGVIDKLAVDFEQRCESAQAPPLFGSLRINSSVPLRP